MNFLLAREDAEKHVGTKSCFYCNKVFNNYRALGGHLRIHQEDRTSRTFNYPGRFSNSTDIARNPPVPLPNSQQNSSGGGNNPTPFTRTPPPADFSRMFCSNETNQASRSRFIGTNPGVAPAPAQVIMPPDFSNGFDSGSPYHHHAVASRAFAPPGAHAAMSAAFPSSGSVVATGFPVDPSIYLGSNVVCQFNTDEFRGSQDGLPPSSGDALQNLQGYSLGRHACSSLDKIGQYDRSGLLTCEESKRSYQENEPESADEMNVSKKPKIAPSAEVEVEPDSPQLKELSLFLDVDETISASEPCGVAEDEVPADVDLSLHL